MTRLDSTRIQKLFYHHTFELRTSKELYRHTLLVNPEDMNMTEPARVNVVQTLGGAYVDDFGQGLPTVSISGVTGYKARENTEGITKDGWTEFRDFREKIYRFFLKSNNPSAKLYWFNWEDDEYYQIQPTSFRMMRNKQAPTLYRYEFQFTCIEKVTSDVKKPVVQESSSSHMEDTGRIQQSTSEAISQLGEIYTHLGYHYMEY